MDVFREQSRSVNWKFLKTKATLLIWRIRLSMIMVRAETLLLLQRTKEIFMQTEEQ